MAFKFIAILALAAIASAAPIEEYQREQHVTPVYKKVAVPAYKHNEYEQEGPAEYEFSYEVNDEHTGDIKSQHETRKGDAVQGSYSLIDSDGFKRIVDYTADDIHGFVAVVRREPTDIKIPTPAPVHYQPAQKYQPTPSAHYQPAQAPAHYQPAQAPAHYQPAQYTKAAPALFRPAQQYNQAPAHYQPQYTKVVAPVVAKVSAPIHHSAPVAKATVDYQANHVSFSSGTGADYHY